MNAEILSVGTELLIGKVVDTNAAFLSRMLAELGINLYFRSTVGDNVERLSQTVKTALKRSDVVIITGGLGPTEDDLTREVVAELMGIELVFDPEIARGLEAKFSKFGYRKGEVPKSNLKQAMVPEKGFGTAVKNEVGTAPGVIFEKDGKCVVCMPGVPTEMKWLFENGMKDHLKRMLAERNEGSCAIYTRWIHSIGIGEAKVEEMLIDLVHGMENPSVATYVDDGECNIRVTARSSDMEDAVETVEQTEKEIEKRLKDAIYGKDSQTLEGVVAQLLREKGLKVACAESCTGGLLGAAFTSLAGSTDYFDRGFIVYTNQAKVDQLGVDAHIIESFGAVSEQTACEMALGALRFSDADVSISITGIAGPGGGTEEKPVGLVYIGLAHDGVVKAEKFNFYGDRKYVRTRTVKMALNMLRKHLQTN